MTSINWTGPETSRQATVGEYLLTVERWSDTDWWWWMHYRYGKDDHYYERDFDVKSSADAELDAIAAMEKHQKANEHIDTKN